MNSPSFFPQEFHMQHSLLKIYKKTRIKPKTFRQLKGAETLCEAGCVSSCQPKGTAEGD